MRIEYSANSSTRALFVKLDCQKVIVWFSKKVPVAIYNKETGRLMLTDNPSNNAEASRLKSIVDEMKLEMHHVKWVNSNTLMHRVQKI